MKALIFDMDDTLANSSPLYKKAFHECFMKYGVDIDDIPVEIEKTFFGRTQKEIAGMLIEYFKLDMKSEKIMDERESIVINLLKNVEPMPGLEMLVEFLKTYDGKKAVATSSNVGYAEIILKKFGMIDLFDLIVTAEDFVSSKPDPEIFLLAAKKMGVGVGDCIVVEDSRNGILAAKNANMKVVGIRNSKFETHQNLSLADFILNNLAELEEVVKKL